MDLGTANVPSNSQQPNQLVEFVKIEIDRYAGYMRHKESMAYTGFALFVGAAGFVLTSTKWPPPAFADHEVAVSAALTVFWFVVLLYLRFQLHRRRWAALRVAGCERVLVEWVTNNDAGELAPKNAHDELNCGRFCRALDWFWPQKGAVLIISGGEGDGPSPQLRERFEMLRRLRIAAIISLFSVVATHSHAGDALTGDQIRELISGNTVHAEHLRKGFTFLVYFDPDGKTAIRVEGGSATTTTYKIEGDAHCIFWNGADRCATIKAEGDGTYTRVNTSGKFKGKEIIKWTKVEEGKQL